MKCPVCPETQLQMTERKGVEIDYCPECRGVWLDRGELDKIIDKTLVETTPSTSSSTPYEQSYDYNKRGEHHGGKTKKRKSFLGEMFDF